MYDVYTPCSFPKQGPPRFSLTSVARQMRLLHMHVIVHAAEPRRNLMNRGFSTSMADLKALITNANKGIKRPERWLRLRILPQFLLVEELLYKDG
jgi:hypothetical protein